jgi:hypothetical protein
VRDIACYTGWLQTQCDWRYSGCAVLCWLCVQVESKSIPDIARELAHLQQLAAAGKLSSLDVTGGSITISNIGEKKLLQQQHTVQWAQAAVPAAKSVVQQIRRLQISAAPPLQNSQYLRG